MRQSSEQSLDKFSLIFAIAFGNMLMGSPVRRAWLSGLKGDASPRKVLVICAQLSEVWPGELEKMFMGYLMHIGVSGCIIFILLMGELSASAELTMF